MERGVETTVSASWGAHSVHEDRLTPLCFPTTPPSRRVLRIVRIQSVVALATVSARMFLVSPQNTFILSVAAAVSTRAPPQTPRP